MSGKKAIFFPVREDEIPPFIDNATKVAVKLENHYGINQEQIKSCQEYNTNVPAKINAAEEAANIAQQRTREKVEELANCRTEFLRLFRFVQDSPKFREEDAEAFGFRKHHTPPDPHTIKPVMSKITSTLEQIIIDWVKGASQGVFIYGSYDGNSWELLGRDSKSPYEDERKNKQPNTPEERYYKLRYIIDDKPVGLESDVAKVIAEIY